MPETASTRYAVLDIRGMMQEPLVRIVGFIGAVYNSEERVLPLPLTACGGDGQSRESSELARKVKNTR